MVGPANLLESAELTPALAEQLYTAYDEELQVSFEKPTTQDVPMRSTGGSLFPTIPSGECNGREISLRDLLSAIHGLKIEINKQLDGLSVRVGNVESAVRQSQLSPARSFMETSKFSSRIGNMETESARPGKAQSSLARPDLKIPTIPILLGDDDAAEWAAFLKEGRKTVVPQGRDFYRRSLDSLQNAGGAFSHIRGIRYMEISKRLVLEVDCREAYHALMTMEDIEVRILGLLALRRKSCLKPQVFWVQPMINGHTLMYYRLLSPKDLKAECRRDTKFDIVEAHIRYGMLLWKFGNLEQAKKACRGPFWLNHTGTCGRLLDIHEVPFYCYTCGKPGHMERSESCSGIQACLRCAQSGHRLKDCPPGNKPKCLNCGKYHETQSGNCSHPIVLAFREYCATLRLPVDSASLEVPNKCGKSLKTAPDDRFAPKFEPATTCVLHTTHGCGSSAEKPIDLDAEPVTGSLRSLSHRMTDPKPPGVALMEDLGLIPKPVEPNKEKEVIPDERNAFHRMMRPKKTTKEAQTQGSGQLESRATDSVPDATMEITDLASEVMTDFVDNAPQATSEEIETSPEATNEVSKSSSLSQECRSPVKESPQEPKASSEVHRRYPVSLGKRRRSKSPPFGAGISNDSSKIPAPIQTTHEQKKLKQNSESNFTAVASSKSSRIPTPTLSTYTRQRVEQNDLARLIATDVSQPIGHTPALLAKNSHTCTSQKQTLSNGTEEHTRHMLNTFLSSSEKKSKFMFSLLTPEIFKYRPTEPEKKATISLLKLFATDPSLKKHTLDELSRVAPLSTSKSIFRQPRRGPSPIFQVALGCYISQDAELRKRFNIAQSRSQFFSNSRAGATAGPSRSNVTTILGLGFQTNSAESQTPVETSSQESMSISALPSSPVSLPSSTPPSSLPTDSNWIRTGQKD